MARSPAVPAIAERATLDPATLRVLADPVRSFIVYSLVPETKTVKRLAEELDCPATRLYYHMQQLERHGLIRVERTRMVSGIREKHYRSVAREFTLDRSYFVGPDGPDPARSEALLSFVFDQTRLEIRQQIERGTLDLALQAPEVGALMAYRNVLKLDDAHARQLHQELFDLWQRYETLAKAPPKDGRFFAFSVALYPNSPGTEPTAKSPSATRSKA